MFTLYTTPLSANGRKVLAVCHQLGLKPDVKLVNVYKGEGRTPEYLAINPLGKIPTLVDGDLTLSESNAILQYIAEAYGNWCLWAREPKRRADIARWLFWESAHWQPTLTTLPELAQAVGRFLGIPGSGADRPSVNWTDPSIVTLARFLDEHLRGRAFLVGEQITLADISVAAMMTYARATRFPFDSFPSIGGWYARIEALEAWKATAVGPWSY